MAHDAVELDTFQHMSKVISQRALRNDCDRVIDAVSTGDSFVVTRDGTAIAELRPIESWRPRFVPKSELVRLAKAGPRIDGDEFRRDLDAIADQRL